ncbi:ribonuclease P protein component [Nautilia profundicola]|uniref:ribonuclease P protein component n=1 Tax=Nautilia profundicola TaxID=244787 RepID=UPI003B849C38
MVFKKGKKFNTEFFLIFYFPLTELKVSPVVSKKISKKAVIRNKIKRRIRSLAYDVLEKGGYAIVAKKDISEYEFAKLKKDFQKIINKIN